MTNDSYEAGTPLYSTAQDIYDALCKLVDTEENSILYEMFEDVTAEGRDYYYTDKGLDLKAKFEEVCDYGSKMWLLDLAIWQSDENSEIHDIVYSALCDLDLAKRIGFKKMFIDELLRGDKSRYDEISEEYCAELGELDRFGYYDNAQAFYRVMASHGVELYFNPYTNFCNELYKKVRNLNLSKEVQIVAECRGLLSSYDDFLLGLRMNKALYDRQEQQFVMKQAQLQEVYENKVKRLLAIAERKGLLEDFVSELPLLMGKNVEMVN